MKVLIILSILFSFNALAEQSRILPYDKKEAGENYEIKENAGMNKFQRIGRNEQAIQDIYQRLESLEKEVKSLRDANKSSQKSTN